MRNQPERRTRPEYEVEHSRRSFVLNGAIAGSALITGIAGQARAQDQPPSRIGSDLVSKFVRVAHGNLEPTRSMLETTPGLLNAAWDWGNGDWETGLGGASHMGRSDIVRFLLSRGARKDIFCAAMLGEAAILSASVTTDPSVAKTQGPHGITLFYHGALSGKIEIATILKEHDTIDDRALLATAEFGHHDLTVWLLKNGIQNVNVRNFRKETPLDVALRKGHTDIADLLREHGGTASG